MSETKFTITEDFFNRIEIHRAPDRWEGRTQILCGRIVERRRDGTIVRDETHENVRIEWPEPELSLWDRIVRFLFPVS